MRALVRILKVPARKKNRTNNRCGFSGRVGANEGPEFTKMLTLRAQSFTSLKEDLRQDINKGFAFSR